MATLPDQRNELARWADRTLPASQYIAQYESSATLNREWGGYLGITQFQYVGGVDDDITIEEWRAQGVRFAIVSYGRYRLWREEGTDPYTIETTLLKSYPPSDADRGPAMVVLLLRPIQHEATGQLGPIRLIGYELMEESAQPGEILCPFHLYWQATGATEDRITRFLTICSMRKGNLVAQADGPPLPDPLLRRGTSAWDDPEEIIYSREYVLDACRKIWRRANIRWSPAFIGATTGQRLLSTDRRGCALGDANRSGVNGVNLANPIFAEAHEERPFWPRRNWWLALLAILVLAGALRFPGL